MQVCLEKQEKVRIFTSVNNDKNKQKPNYYDKIKQNPN